jgi:hypothetical protein
MVIKYRGKCYMKVKETSRCTRMRTHTWLVVFTLTSWRWEKRGSQQKSTAMWRKSQFSKERTTQHQRFHPPNHICSLDVLRTQSPNSCPRFSSRSSWDCHIQLWGSIALHGVLLLIHLQSASHVLLCCVELQIAECQGPQGPSLPCPGEWHSPLCNPGTVRLGMWAKRT